MKHHASARTNRIFTVDGSSICVNLVLLFFEMVYYQKTQVNVWNAELSQ